MFCFNCSDTKTIAHVSYTDSKIYVNVNCSVPQCVDNHDDLHSPANATSPINTFATTIKPNICHCEYQNYKTNNSIILTLDLKQYIETIHIRK